MVTKDKNKLRETLDAEQRRFNALSQEQRRKELNAKGLHHVSAVPPPLEPVRNTGAMPPHALPKRPAPAANWDVWANMPKAKLWQAVALSLDSEPPDELGRSTGYGPAFDRKLAESIFPDEFSDRLKVAQGNVSMDGPLHPLQLGVLNDPNAPVNLAEFGAWAVLLGWTLPERFPREVAAQATNPTNAAQETPEQRAIRLHLQMNILKGQGVRNYAKQVADGENITTARLRQITAKNRAPAVKPIDANDPFRLSQKNKP